MIGRRSSPLGRLRSYTTGGTTTEFLYDGDRLVAEYVSNVVARRYAHGPGVDEPLIWYEGSSISSGQNWLIADRQGSIVATTNASGTATYAYDPYGIPREWTGPRFRYTGQMILSELQLYHYKARVYDPGLGRFLQTDPVGYQADMNLYAYSSDDPINLIDPTGLADVCATGTGTHLESCVSVMRMATGTPQTTHLRGNSNAPSAANSVASSWPTLAATFRLPERTFSLSARSMRQMLQWRV